MFEPSLHWINGIGPYRIALMPHPHGGEWLSDEVEAWRDAKIDCIISLLESQEVRELELRAQPSLCVEHGIEFRSFPIPDRGTPPSTRELLVLLAQLHSKLLQGEAVAIHCRAGIGRAGLFAGCLLHLLGIPGNEIFHLLSRSRGVTVPDTAVQVEWVERFVHAYPQPV